ncbi:hypothetical protein CesoFtcFv8_013242 [Champsocephalus esox]|uniref:Uncharacterized protein n=1 Tax=Champsocephalus esox TaxID=159716 RepID=A0AAN8BVZ0_9TELE|nr:hypothetical protein CesoFtcFv8_013242 [Champsocephalus esox]
MTQAERATQRDAYGKRSTDPGSTLCVGSCSWRAKQQRVSSSVTLLTQSHSGAASTLLSEVITGSKLHPHMGLLLLLGAHQRKG